MQSFSERENGEMPRDNEHISETVWGGIRALIQARVEDGSFGANYRESCSDGPITIGTDTATFRDAMRGQVRGLPTWPWRSYGVGYDADEVPDTLKIMDMIEFYWSSIGKPISIEYHSYGKHHHLRFDIEDGREQFRNEIETIFRLNGIAFTLTEQGRVERLIPEVFRADLSSKELTTGDSELNRLLETAVRKFIDTDPDKRREALEALWDAFERLKTLDEPGDKALSTQAMLDRAAGEQSPKFRDALEREAKQLTKIGNSLRIRHSEITQEHLVWHEHIDYLFYRLFSHMRLIIRSRQHDMKP